MEGEGQEKEVQREGRKGELLMAEYLTLNCNSLSKTYPLPDIFFDSLFHRQGNAGDQTYFYFSQAFMTLYNESL